jgi:ATP-dependent Lhr-like helicase
MAGRIDAPDCLSWLEAEFFLDPPAARRLCGHVRRQLLRAGCLPTDRTLFVEAFRDPLGDWQIAMLSPFGSRLHLALRLVLEALLTQRLGYRPQCLHHNDGILIRLADAEEPPLDLFDGLNPENVEALLLAELADSALFALRFRQNAARALLLPRSTPGKRAPLWLQRLRGKDLLQVARRHPDFPIIAETLRECLHDHLDLPRLQQLVADVGTGRVEVVSRKSDGPSPFAAGLLFAFTAAFMYQDDRPHAEAGRPASLDQRLLEQLVAPEHNGHLLDPRAVQQVERRLRGFGQPPRTAPETAEWLRRLGDLSAADLEGPMGAFLEELEAGGVVQRIDLPACREPRRWILAEEEGLYRQAFGVAATATDGRDSQDLADSQAAAETILRRFLETHALVSLDDVLGRYPFEADWARRRFEHWARTGAAVAVRAPDAPSVEWSAPENLEQVQRRTLALLRREVVTCPPGQFADFLLRWQGVNAAAAGDDPGRVAEVLERLRCLPLPAELWEQTVLPGRVPAYQPGWLDEGIARGEWTWACQGNDDTGPGLLAFFRREHLGLCAPPPFGEVAAADPAAEQLLESLRCRGASFVTDLARDTGLPPSAVRTGLWTLLRCRLVTNDHYDVIRRGEEAARGDVPGRPVTLSSRRRTSVARPEGRWSLIPWGQPDPEGQAVYQAKVVLRRYGIVARELALMDPWILPWRVLHEVLSRMELAGEVRRGYFVEGLSGAQFAVPEAGQRLQEMSMPSAANSRVILLHSLDPANLYGSGAPFDVPLLEGGTRPLVRRPGNWLVVRAGRPVLIIEQNGRRLTALASASREDIVEAVARLPALHGRIRGLGPRHKLTVEEWNGEPVTATAGRALLEAAGFVRDYQAMTLYPSWR